MALMVKKGTGGCFAMDSGNDGREWTVNSDHDGIEDDSGQVVGSRWKVDSGQ